MPRHRDDVVPGRDTPAQALHRPSQSTARPFGSVEGRRPDAAPGPGDDLRETGPARRSPAVTTSACRPAARLDPGRRRPVRVSRPVPWGAVHPVGAVPEERHVPSVDFVNNRTKRIFNNHVEIAAARSTAPYLFQKYQRDNGEFLFDLGVPVIVRGQHFGAIRLGFRPAEGQ